MFSKYVEAFPTKHQTATAVAKALTCEIIPCYGIPSLISSDNGTLAAFRLHLGGDLGMGQAVTHTGWQQVRELQRLLVVGTATTNTTTKARKGT